MRQPWKIDPEGDGAEIAFAFMVRHGVVMAVLGRRRRKVTTSQKGVGKRRRECDKQKQRTCQKIGIATP